MSNLRFDGRTVLVTDGAGGFGSQTCRSFSEKGFVALSHYTHTKAIAIELRGTRPDGH